MAAAEHINRTGIAGRLDQPLPLQAGKRGQPLPGPDGPARMEVLMNEMVSLQRLQKTVKDKMNK